MKINWANLLRTVELTVVSALAAFLATISQTSGADFDAKHLAAAGIAALIALGYRLAGVISAQLDSTVTAPVVSPPMVQSSVPLPPPAA